MTLDLKDILTPERVAVNVQAKDWEEAVRQVGQLLVDTGVVEGRYVDSMVATTKELGPYIVIAPGLAIPHGRPEDGVLQPCMAVAMLDAPVNFGNPDNDPVRILIALGAVDAVQHVEALRQMAEILSDEGNFKALQAARSREDVLKILWSASTSA
jgi:mannitol/fructose-specific phosphotransferase system IIA component (Ntr-type)